MKKGIIAFRNVIAAIFIVFCALALPILVIFIFIELHSFFVSRFGFSDPGENVIKQGVNLFLGCTLFGIFIYLVNFFNKVVKYIESLERAVKKNDVLWVDIANADKIALRNAACPIPILRKLIWGSK